MGKTHTYGVTLSPEKCYDTEGIFVYALKLSFSIRGVIKFINEKQ